MELEEAEIRKYFDLHDIEQEGSIQCGEVTNALKLLFKIDELPSDLEEKIQDGTSGDEKLSYEKFEDFAKLMKDYFEAEELKEAFRVIARKNPKNRGKKDADLCVDFDAVKKLLKMMSGDDAIPEEELDEMIKAADTDQSGTIEIEEFVDFMMCVE